MPHGYADTPAGRALAAASEREARAAAVAHLQRRSVWLDRIEAEFGRDAAEAATKRSDQTMQGVPGQQQHARAADAARAFYEEARARRTGYSIPPAARLPIDAELYSFDGPCICTLKADVTLLAFKIDEADDGASMWIATEIDAQSLDAVLDDRLTLRDAMEAPFYQRIDVDPNLIVRDVSTLAARDINRDWLPAPGVMLHPTPTYDAPSP